MAIGIIVTKADLDREMGQLTKDIQTLLRRAADFKTFFDAYTSAQIESMWSYPSGDGDRIKSMWADGNQLNDIYTGAANLAVAKDFRTFMKNAWGAGGAY